MQKQGISFLTGAFVILFGLGSYFGVASIYRAGLFPAVLGEDNQEEQKAEESKTENKDKNDSAKKQAESAREAAKQQSERTREAAKQQTERVRETAKNQMEQSKNSDGNNVRLKDDESEAGDDADENALETEAEDNGENGRNDERMASDLNGVFTNRDKALAHLNEQLAETEKHLLEKQAEGADVSVALARLAAARASVSQVGVSIDNNDMKQAEALAEQIKKEAHFTENDVHDAKQVAEETKHVVERFAQVNEKIAKLEGRGVDTAAFKSRLASLQSDFQSLQAASAATPGAVTRDMVKAFEDKVKNLKRSLESSLFANGSTDGEGLAKDHEDGATELEDDLNEVADIEDGATNGVSATVRKIAADHKASTVEVADSLGAIERRTGLTKTLLGPDYTALDRLNTQVTAMIARAGALESVAGKISDPDIQKMLTDQAVALRSEAATLQSYATVEDSQFSLLGSFLKLFR